MNARPAGHTFRVGRTRIEEGWRLIATCTCRHTITTNNYGDLNALVNDHYADIRTRRARTKDEKAHT